MQPPHDSHLATIAPINADEAKQVMNLPSLLSHNVAFIAVQTGWIWLSIVGWYFFTAFDVGSGRHSLGILLLLMSVMWLMAQFVIIFIYPEWPMNRLLSSRLRRSIANRSDRPDWAADQGLRVVELVPRERWSKMLLDTATDLLVLRVNASGVWLEGDCDRYLLPPESILGVELETVRPSGWFTDTHMVIIYVRTEEGPHEIPISYRDHAFGCLRNLRRRNDAMDLVDQISSIAKGHHFNPLTISAAGGLAAHRLDGAEPAISALGKGPVDATTSHPYGESNPYAPPSIHRG